MANHLILALLALAMLLTVMYVSWQWRRTWRVGLHLRQQQELGYAEQLPSVSVIVYARNLGDALERNLPALLRQQYDAPWEVIVVNDGSTDNTADVISAMLASYGNLRTSFTSYETRALSRKKLALMIGAKAARYDVIVTTTAECAPASDEWLATMARNFAAGVDVVIGYTVPDYKADRGAGRWYRAFDYVNSSVQYLNAAIKGTPYRGTTHNLAYRKQLFFDNKGFSGSLDLRWGEDDIFLSEIASGDNTRVELEPQGRMIARFDDMPHAWRELKMRRDFTSRFVRRKQLYVQGLMSCAYYLRLAAIAAAVALDWHNCAVLAVALLLELAAWLPSIFSYRRNCTLLGAPRLFFAVPLFTLWRPLKNFALKLREKRYESGNYTSMYD